MDWTNFLPSVALVGWERQRLPEKPGKVSRRNFLADGRRRQLEGAELGDVTKQILSEK